MLGCLFCTLHEQFSQKLNEMYIIRMCLVFYTDSATVASKEFLVYTMQCHFCILVPLGVAPGVLLSPGASGTGTRSSGAPAYAQRDQSPHKWDWRWTRWGQAWWENGGKHIWIPSSFDGKTGGAETKQHTGNITGTRKHLEQGTRNKETLRKIKS